MQNHAKKWSENINANTMAAIAISAMLIFSVAGMKAFADVVVSDIVVNDKTVSITAGEKTTVRYQIIIGDNRTPEGDRPGCNANGANPVGVTINTPSGVTSTPSSLTFTACDVWQSVEFTSDNSGDYQITVDATGGRTGSSYDESAATFTLAVDEQAATDTTPPELNLPSDITQEATSADGAVVTYEASATDNIDGPVAIDCTPASGSTFALGSTTVNCKAQDNAGNQATGSFNVIVQDKTAPELTLPSDITQEATSADGAVVTYEASATDNIDGPVAIDCTPASGSTFPLGTTAVDCSATDNAGNQATGSFSVTIQDKTAPELNLPSDITQEATSADGAVVTYEASATDNIDGPVAIDCTPASGSTFALGSTTVNCKAQDNAGNQATGSFNVIVQDKTAPELTLPSDITQEATSADGAVVTYEASATDNIDGPVAIDCTPASGSTFPLGTTAVDCSATDNAGNQATGSFNVIVQDTIKPVIQVKGTISDGQQFYFGDVPATPTCTATDSGSGVNSVGCNVEGYATTVGPQTLTFTATDNAGNTATQTIKYTVLAWTIKGFYQPVDNNGVINTVKGGSTVPLKFEVFKGGTELTDASAIKTPLTSKKVACDNSSPIDDIETVASGNTALRYDSTAGQFIYNWQTLKKPGECHSITVATQDGSSITALFKLK